jgi:hypothetical protein
MIISVKINTAKIDKTKMFKGEKGTYLDITLLENKGGPDQYGNDFMVVQDIGKEARDKGEKGAILGNAKIRGGKPAAAPAPKAAPKAQPADASDDCAF